MNYVKTAKKLLAKQIDVPDDLLELYTLLVFTTGRSTTWENVHDAWSIWQSRTNPSHKSLVPFAELSNEVKAMDEEYAVAIKLVANKVHNYSNHYAYGQKNK